MAPRTSVVIELRSQEWTKEGANPANGKVCETFSDGILKISLIIPTCHRHELLRDCLNRLEIPPCPPDEVVEVIVTDDSRDGETRSMVEKEFPRVRYVQGPRRGPASNRNAGAAAAIGEWLIFLDDDCLPVPGFLKAYRDAMMAEAGPMVALEGPTVSEADPPSLLWEAPHNPDGGHLISCNFAMRKEDFERVGRFDERYPGAALEDTEFAARFRFKGGQINLVSAATVGHPLRAIPSARRLAGRWEGKVIFALDQGASPLLVRFWLPWHVGRVIQSRLRWAGSCSPDNARAAMIFAMEWLWVVWLTPGWVSRWSREPCSPFWAEHVRLQGALPKYGF